MLPIRGRCPLGVRGIFPPRLRAFSLSWRWGIGARLGVAFAAVAGLAVAANLAIQHQNFVTHTTRVVRIAVPTPSSASAVAPRSLMSPALLPVDVMSPKSLIAAIEHYEVAVRSRLAFHDGSSDRQLAGAVAELERETQAYLSQPNFTGASHQESLRAPLLQLRSHGDELARAADRRQFVLKEFWDRFDVLDARTKKSLAGSWKIFGRVIARKSLVDLNSSLDEIRRSLARLPTTDLYSQEVLDRVRASERALMASLETSETALINSQGEEWVMKMRADVARISTLQESLRVLDTERRLSEGRFAGESLSLIALAGAAIPPTARDTARAASSEIGAASVASVAATSAATGTVSDQASEASTTTSDKPQNFTLIFWVSAAVLTLLLWVSIRTVMSVVGPVRLIREATLRLAAGDAGVRVTRGGIRELDDLAVSFNQMAGQLADAKAAARNYQERLEAKVDLRTRELQHLAEHDPLTQLPNRRQLFTHLKAAIARAESSGAYVGVFFVDLDNFKNINDSLGHAFGDRVLGAIAGRLRDRAGASGFAARLGGDEFTIVCDGITDREAVSAMGRDLVRAFQQPIAVDGRYLMISISVGASLYPDHGGDAEALLRAADAALFRAKALGRSQLTMFSQALLEAASAKFSTEQGLRYALERGEFELVFQPEVDAASLSTRLVEALLRWRLPDGRRALPSEFLSVAEESGLIMEISDWVLRTSIETAAGWYYGGWPEARIAINLSSRQLLDSRFVDHVMGLLQEHRLPAHCIEIELTENVLQTGAATIEVLHQLRNHGVAIALDDFGIGYSSLASLEKLPLTRVKLDRALIASIHLSPKSAAITRALVGLCHNLGLEVTAEGIESPEQLMMLAALSPICLQGYLLARPASKEALLPVLAQLPNHMTSLLLSSAETVTNPGSPEEFVLTQWQALRG
jgi:diguanylate cyclase (GGDEF)-like protein